MLNSEYERKRETKPFFLMISHMTQTTLQFAMNHLLVLGVQYCIVIDT